MLSSEKARMLSDRTSKIMFFMQKMIVSLKISLAAHRGKYEIAVSRSISDELIEYLQEQGYEVILNSDVIAVAIYGHYIYDPIYIKW